MFKNILIYLVSVYFLVLSFIKIKQKSSYDHCKGAGRAGKTITIIF